jgi:hypothetical protein
VVRWRTIRSRLVLYGRHAMPVVISGGLITWLIWHVTPAKLFAALSTGVWHWLVLATALQIIVSFFWDATCVWWLFAQPDRPLSYWAAVRARGEATLWSAINLEIGGGVFAWKMSRLQKMTLTDSLGRLFLLALFDFGTLQSLALVGSFLRPADLLVAWLRWVSAAVLFGLFVLIVAYYVMPNRWHSWLVQWKLAHWLRWWSWRHSLKLWAMRLTMFLIVVTYAGVCLAISGIHMDVWIVLGVIPYVLVAEALPGTGGLGEREWALILLLHVPTTQSGMILSFGLIWSVMTILGRITIGSISTWLPHQRSPLEEKPPESVAA